MVTVALPNSVEWFVAVAAAWKLGATPQPVGAHLPVPELRAIVDLADPAVVIGAGPEAAGDRPCLPEGYRPAPPAPGRRRSRCPTRCPRPGRRHLGRLHRAAQADRVGERSLLDPDGTIPLRLQPDGCLVMPGPLYHNGPIVWSCQALLWGNHVAVLPRFDGEATLAAIEAHRAETVYLVPTMMKRIWRLPEAVRNATTSARSAPCGTWPSRARCG